MAKNISLAYYLKQERKKQKLTLRDIEKLSKNKISNPYFSQLEQSPRRFDPSPHALREISKAMKLDYINLLIVAGYLTRKEIGKYVFGEVK